MSAYYNEIDPFAAAWLRELIKAGHIADGEVDQRSITEVTSNDLQGFTQHHFFAGIGGWSYALRLAGGPDDRPAWTGSCPCQPFSQAGTGKGKDDARHLWPAWLRLVRECRPNVIFGEQAEAAIRHGWLDDVCNDLEGIDYAGGSVGLPAACVGAPHIRARRWFVADSQELRRQGSGLCEERGLPSFGIEDNGGLGNADGSRPQGRLNLPQHPSELAPWSASMGVACADGKIRPAPLEPAFSPLVDGLSVHRVGILRGAGNAIVPQVAAEFIRAYAGCERA